MFRIHFSLLLSSLFISVISFAQSNPDSVHLMGERHIFNIRQLTFGGDNAEAYWSFDGKKICFQRTDHKTLMCDQIFFGSVPQDSDQAFSYQMVSTGKGRTTCSYFMPGDSLVLFASTHANADSCPPVPDRHKIGKYVWPLYDSYDIYISGLDGKVRKQLTSNPGYDAEATVSPKGDKIVFTSMRSGDPELYTMNIDGSNVKQITNTMGYDGGANFSPDGKKIVWRASRPTTVAERTEYSDLLAQGLVAPTDMALFVANADGTDVHQITNEAGASWAPAWLPNNKQIIFASNFDYPRGFPFNLYIINIDGSGLTRITGDEVFDAFPLFSPDGRQLIFCSNRNNGGGHDTNIFIADWR